MMENNKKEVFFETYCPKCKFKDTKETDDPCNNCLAYGWNVDSHRPVFFKESEDAEEN